MPSGRTILCADPSAPRLATLSHMIQEAGYPVLMADSAAQCISLSAKFKPRIAFIDQELFEVDQWSIPEQVHMLSPKTLIVLVVEEVERWQQVPCYVDAVAKRLDAAELIAILRGARPGQ